MKSVSLILALVCAAVGVAGFVTLITSVTADCDAVTNLIGVCLFMVGSVAASHFAVKGLGIEIKPNVKYSKT